MCTTLQRVLIQFEDPMTSASTRSAFPFFTSDIAISQLLRPPGQGFGLHGRGKPAWDPPTVPSPEWRAPLTPEDTDHLLALLEELVVGYVAPRPTGFDGSWHILDIAAGAHTMRFEWRADVPPGWERAAALTTMPSLLPAAPTSRRWKVHRDEHCHRLPRGRGGLPDGRGSRAALTSRPWPTKRLTRCRCSPGR